MGYLDFWNIFYYLFGKTINLMSKLPSILFEQTKNLIYRFLMDSCYPGVRTFIRSELVHFIFHRPESPRSSGNEFNNELCSLQWHLVAQAILIISINK